MSQFVNISISFSSSWSESDDLPAELPRASIQIHQLTSQLSSTLSTCELQTTKKQKWIWPAMQYSNIIPLNNFYTPEF